jgi:hypothetical protein
MDAEGEAPKTGALGDTETNFGVFMQQVGEIVQNA